MKYQLYVARSCHSTAQIGYISIILERPLKIRFSKMLILRGFLYFSTITLLQRLCRKKNCKHLALLLDKVLVR